MRRYLVGRFPDRGLYAVRIVLAGALYIASLPADALVWPGPAPCDTTLQACIDGAADGATIEIGDEGFVPEVTLQRSVVLRAVPGFTPTLRGVRGSFNTADDVSVTIERIRVFEGRVELLHLGAGTANFTVRDVSIIYPFSYPTDGTVFGIVMRTSSAASGGPLNFDIRGNSFERAGQGRTFPIDVISDGPSAAGVVAFNRIDMPVDTESTYAIRVGRGRTNTVRARVFGNAIRGDFTLGHVGVTTASSAEDAGGQSTVDIASNLLIGRSGTGIGIAVGTDNGTSTARIYNNTILGQQIGIKFATQATTTSPTFGGAIVNNLIAHNENFSVQLHPAAGAIANQNNLIFDSGIGSGFTPGPGTVTADPMLFSVQQPWLLAGSPAIDAGDSVYGALTPAIAGIPLVDADGLRRASGPAIDIGAREFGDLSLLHVSAATSISGNVSTLDHPQLSGDPTASLFSTPLLVASTAGPGPLAGEASTFVYQTATSRWRIRLRDTVPFPLEARFGIFRPRSGIGVIPHLTTASSVSGFATQIDHSQFNDRADKFVLVAQNQSVAGAGVFNPRPIGMMFLDFGGSGRWWVVNTDGATMPLGVGFNLYAQDASPNAFRVVATSANTLGSWLVLDHRLLNGVSCAQPQVSRVFTGTATAAYFDLRYEALFERWAIVQQNGSSIPLGSAFNVLVVPRQVHDCTQPLFADGFEAAGL